jgi:hypothetical protein
MGSATQIFTRVKRNRSSSRRSTDFLFRILFLILFPGFNRIRAGIVNRGIYST